MHSIVIIDNNGNATGSTNDYRLFPLDIEGVRWSEDYWPAGERWPQWEGYDVASAAVVGEGDDEEVVAWALLAPID